MASAGDAEPVPDPEVERILAERARALAVPRSGDLDETSVEAHLLTRVGDRVVAIPARSARHVVPATRVARLVESGTAIAGLAVVHGELTPVADLAGLLQLEVGSGPATGGHFVVVDDDDGALALLVDEVEGLRSLDLSDVGVDSAAEASAPGLVAAVAAGGVYVLDLAAVLADSRLWPPAEPA